MAWYYAIALLFASSASLSVCVVAIVRRRSPGAVSLAVFCGAMFIWTLLYALSLLSRTAEWTLFWLRGTYLGILAVPPAFLLYAMNYTGWGVKWKSRLIPFLTVEPVIILALLWAKPLGLEATRLDLEWSVLGGGFGYWANLIYSYALLLGASLIIILSSRRFSPGLRGQANAVLLGLLFPWLANLASLLHLNPFPDLDLSPIAFTLTSLCFGAGILLFRLFDINPVARAVILENLVDGVIVLDDRRRIVDINPAALRLLNMEGRRVLGQPLEEVCPAAQDCHPPLDSTEEKEKEVALGDPPRAYLNVRFSPLFPRDRGKTSWMVTVRDVTEARMARLKEGELRSLAEALRETAAAMNRSHTLEEVLDQLLDSVGRVIPHDMANFLLVDDAGIARVACARGYREHRMRKFTKNLSIPIEAVPGFHRMVETGQAIVIPDTLSSDEWVPIEEAHPIRSYVGAPVKVKGIVVGFLDLDSLTPDFFTPAQAEQLQAFADQAAIAIENARLFEEIQQNAAQLTALLDIGRKMTSSLDLKQILRILLRKCMEILPVEVFYVAIYDRETGIIQHPLFFDMGKHRRIPPHDILVTPGLSGYIIQSRKTLYLPDLFHQDAVDKFGLIRTGGTPTRSYLGVPLIAGDHIVGVISIQSYRKDAYTAGHIRLLQTIATQAAGLIENSRLYKKAQEELVQRKEAEHRYRALFEQSHDAVFMIDFDGRHIQANHRAAEMLGYSVDELKELYIHDISVELSQSEEARQRLLKGEHMPLYERQFRKKNGEVITVEINVELVRDMEGKPLHIQSVVRDISERKETEIKIQAANQALRKQLAEIQTLQAQLREQAIRDPLTGLYNRRYLEDALTREFESAKRASSPVCLVMMDIDGFKDFNDRFGHDAGDYLLRQLGVLLQAEVRRSDISCRYGGEEFVVVMPGAPLDRGLERAERLRETFENTQLEHMGMKLNATLSLGVAAYPRNGLTWETVLHAADRAMYAAKGAGKNSVRSAGN